MAANTNVTLDCDKYNDPKCFSPDTAVPWETDYAALVPRFTGSLSAISSALIMYVILRSSTRLSSIYHRIMFGMSLADICGSIAMALTSLPMPSYMPKEEIFGYKWAGTRLGNTYTCNAQGFFATFGVTAMYNYNAMLCVYYACAIAFTMKEKNIKRYVEPILHGFPLLFGLSCSVPPLFFDMYNPGISAYAWCGAVPYPDECTFYDVVECIRGSAKMKKVLQYLMSVSVISVFAFITVSLVLVVFKVIQTDRVILQISKLYRNRGHPEMETVLKRHRNSKVVIIQAFSYITAFLLGVLPPLLLSVGAIDNSRGENGDGVADSFEKLSLTLLPLQGFFNFVIFVSHKVYNYRRVHRDVSTCRVLYLLFCSSAHEPFFISRISVVKRDEDEAAAAVNAIVEFGDEEDLAKAGQSKIVELGVHDESNMELHYRLSLMKRSSNEPSTSGGGNMMVLLSDACGENNDLEEECSSANAAGGGISISQDVLSIDFSSSSASNKLDDEWFPAAVEHNNGDLLSSSHSASHQRS